MSFLRRRQFETSMDAELRFHVDAFIEDLIRSGVGRTEAERRARVEFGALEATKDECREAWGWQRLDESKADLRLTFRALRQNPGFASIAILSLALGIGANTAIFGLVDAVLLRVLPVRDPGQLVFVDNAGTQGLNGGPPYPCFELFREKTHSFDGLAAFSPSNMEMIADGGREQIRGIWVSGNFYDLLGVKPLIGRTLSSSDDQIVGKGGSDGPVAVISEGFWRRRFNADPKVMGRTVHLSDNTVTIVGVMPSGLMSIEPGRTFDIAAPMMLSDPTLLRNHGSWWLDIVGRLKPGFPTEQARTETDALFQVFMDKLGDAPMRKLAFDHIELVPAAQGTDGLRRQLSVPLIALMVLSGLVLLAACTNVANLMLARATARQKEFAVRLAIGAGKGRLIRQTLTEAAVLVGAGAALGILLARQGEVALMAFFAEGSNRIALDLSLDGRLLLFAISVSLLTGLSFGILPAIRAARVDPAEGLQSSSRSSSQNRNTPRLGRLLVVIQVMLSTILLACAGLFIRSLTQLKSVDLGFTRDGIMTMEVTPEKFLFGTPEWTTLQTQVLDRVRSVPGVRSASWSTRNPLTGRERTVVVEIPEFAPHSPTDNQIHLTSTSPEYFETFGMPIVMGRKFTTKDDASASKVAILNETAARFYFSGANPIGKRVTLGNKLGKIVFEIVGLVKDVKQESPRDEPWRFIYLPIPQSVDRVNRLALAVRGVNGSTPVAASIRKEVLGVRSSLLITNVTTIGKQLQLALFKERLISTLAITFGALALILACVGLYGTLAYAVLRRTNEIGVRMALGATRRGVIWLVLREGLTLVLSGIAIAFPAVLALSRIIRSMLYQVGPFDSLAHGSVVLLLLASAAVAAVIPALRASRLDPMSALRRE